MPNNKSAFDFGIPISIPLAILMIAAVALVAALWWWPRLRGLPPGKRKVITFLRVAALALLLFMVLDPTVIRHRTEPGEDYVVMLFDDSRSMRIAGDDGISRGQRLLKGYDAARHDFEDPLRETHHLALYRFGQSPRRLGNVKELTFDQTESDLSGSIQTAVRDLAGAKVSAVVLFSDGVQQGSAPPTTIDAGSNRGVPVYTVGVDTESIWRDLELHDIAVTRTNFDKSPVAITAAVSARGLKGHQAIIEAVENNKVVTSKTIPIPDDTMETKVRLEFVPQNQGWELCEARVRLVPPSLTEVVTSGGKPAMPAIAERVMENNSSGFVVDNRKKSYRILYLCGRPNWQNKFVSRALDSDPELKLSTLIRISSPNRKFDFRPGGKSINNVLYEGFDENELLAPRYDEASYVRIGMAPAEMEKGYPEKAEDLFPFNLIIWGDIEADFFSPKHMEVTRDFVSKRGGSLLLMGGPRALSEGRFAGTLIESMLPVLLKNVGPAPVVVPNADGTTPPPFVEENMKQLFRAKPTVEGFLSGVWSLDPDPARNAALWAKQPELYGVNLFPIMRAGSTKEANVQSDSESVDGQTLFAEQRYGLGRCAVLATGETWQWQMQNEPDEVVHNRFWRQLVRSMVTDVPQPVMLQSPHEGFVSGATSKLSFLVRDASFNKREGLNTNVKLTAPGQAARDLPAEESIAEPGVYNVDFTPEATGLHVLSLTSLNEKSEVIGQLEQAVDVQPDLREFQGAKYNPEYLKSVSQATKGAFYTLDQLGQLAKAIPHHMSTEEKPDYYHLWRFPGFFALLVAIFGLEWFLRRKYGQP